MKRIDERPGDRVHIGLWHPLRTWILLLGASVALCLFAPHAAPALPFRVGLAPPARQALAVLLLAVGAALPLTATRELKRAGVQPNFGATPQLVTTGLFSYTRNPGYLGFAMILLALAVGAGSTWPLLLLLPWLALLEVVVVPREEAALHRWFGEQYKQYKHDVPRWLLCLEHRLWRA